MRRLLIGLTVLLITLSADAQQPVKVTNPGPPGSNTAETIACNAGVSPCTIGAAATNVLNNSTSGRKGCILQNVNATDFFCKKATAAGSAASTTNMDFLLKAASAANKGDGGIYSCDSAGVVYTGPINCTGSAGGGTLVASAQR